MVSWDRRDGKGVGVTCPYADRKSDCDGGYDRLDEDGDGWVASDQSKDG